MRASLFVLLFGVGACTAHAAPQPTLVAAVPCACEVDDADHDDDDDDDEENLEEAMAALEADLDQLEDLGDLGEMISERVEAIVEAALDDLDVKLDGQLNVDFDDDDDDDDDDE
jgi:hypothetical protein